MRSRFAKLFNGVLGLVLVLSALGVAAPAPVAADGVTLPGYVKLVQEAASQEWLQQPGSQKTGPVSVLVHVGMSPLAMVGKNWNHQQRVDYVAQIRAAQDALIPQIEALGGKVRGRFTHLSTGLGVDIDASKVDELRGLGNVIAVRGVAKYELDLTETVGWIGASAVQSLGVTGEGVDVAVLDSGVDYTHVKFGGPGTLDAYNTAYCGNPAVGADPFDPACTAHDFADVTGMFGDSAYGRDGSPDNKVVGGWDWVGDKWPAAPATSDPNPIDCGNALDPLACDGGHGTHVADIIGGLESAPGAGDAGVAPGANVWMFKVCSSVSTSCEGLALLLAMDDAMDLDDSDYGVCTPGVDPFCLDYDPADVINMSLGSLYGQPEDDLTLFSNIASYYGSLVVVSAGNSGDRPYIVGSPSTAEGALSVAQSTVPSDKFYAISAGAVTVGGVLQPWSPAIVGAYSGVLQYGDGAGGNKNGCAAFAPGSLTGKVLLVDRGTCNVSIKGSNGSAAGAAFVIMANNAFSNTPPTFSFGGGTVTVPMLTVTLNDGAALKTVLGSTASLSETGFILLQDDIVASSSRGPRIADGDIKPDIAAPGASVSAEVGTGTGKTAFGGTSGAAPMASGSAALMVEALEDRGVLDSNPGLGAFVPFLKSLLMNTANPNTKIGGSFLAPITLQGAGRVDALSAFNSGTIAMDVTDLNDWLFTGMDMPCTVTPTAVWDFLFFGAGALDCADDYPYGNDFFNAWNSQTGSLSFGYDGVSSSQTEKRKVLIWNASASSKTYNLSSAFRYSNDAAKGVTLKASPSSLTIPAGDLALVDVTMKINARDLRSWTLNAGSFGNAGTNIYCFNPNPDNGCPTLTMFEVDGFLTINGGPGNTVRMPWQVLPKKAANTKVASHTASSVKLSNSAKYKPGDTDVFSLVDVSPNNCEIVDGVGDCVEANYVPGILPGINTTPIDIHEVGVREYQAPGLNAALGLPAAPFGAINNEVVEFGLTVYDAPYRTSHNFPVEFDIYVDSNSDGVDDYVVFNYDVALTGGDGRNAVFVQDINPSNGTRPRRPYFYSVTNFNSQNWILPVPAAAIDAVSTKPISFFVLAFDAYFTGSLWDCSPFNGGLCGGAYHSYTTGLPKFRPVTTSLQVPKQGNYTLSYSTPASGALKSPSQIGLLFMYRDAKVGAESENVTLP